MILPRFSNRSAFTLIEVVISAALMALILASGYVCLNAGFSSQKIVEARSDAAQSARAALAVMSADLRSACELSPEYQFLGMDRMIEDVEADNLDFGTHNYSPRHAGESDFCEVSYFLGKDPSSENYILFRRRDASRDPEPLAGGSREELVRGVRGLRFEYYDGFDWYDEWGDPRGKRKGQPSSLLDPPNLTGIPEAVRITLWMDAQTTSRRSEEEEREGPMVFRTVARINLATAWSRSSQGSGSPSTSTQNSGQQQQQPTMEGVPPQ